MSAALFGDDAVRRKMRAQPLDNKFLAGPIGLSDQIEIALQLEWNAALKEIRQQRAAFAGDLHCSFKVRHRYSSSTRYLMSCLKIKRLGRPSRVMRMKL